MKKLSNAAMLIAGALLAAASARASITANDLYMGFQDTGSSDYIVNLGTASSIVGGSSVVDLSGAFNLSDLNSIVNANPLFGGVVGGSNTGTSDIYLTQLRSGGAGNPATAGSSVSQTLSVFGDNTAYADLTQLNGPPAGSSALDSGKTWQTYVEDLPGPQGSGTFWSDTGVNPDSAVSIPGVLYEDLWYTSSSGAAHPFSYLGYFTLDTTGASPSLTFTPEAVPEPGTAVIAGISGLSLLMFRRRFSKNA